MKMSSCFSFGRKRSVALLAMVCAPALMIGQIFYEPFSLGSGVDLGTQSGWTNANTGDLVVGSTGSLSVSGLASSSGNSVAFGAAGIDPQRTFTAVTTGTVWYSFAMQVTSLGSLDATGGYFAGLGASTTNFSSTVWTRLDGTGFDIGLQNATTVAGVQWTTGTQTVGSTLFIVGSFDLATDVASMWVNPGSADFGVTAPTPTFTSAAGTTRTSLDRFFLRQDSTNETPNFIVDELRVGISWADVTPAAVSAIPEPSTYAAIFGGLALVGAVVYRRRQAKV